jgi:hypothetical protein
MRDVFDDESEELLEQLELWVAVQMAGSGDPLDALVWRSPARSAVLFLLAFLSEQARSEWRSWPLKEWAQAALTERALFTAQTAFAGTAADRAMLDAARAIGTWDGLDNGARLRFKGVELLLAAPSAGVIQARASSRPEC